MAKHQIIPPKGWSVVGDIYDTEHPELLNDVMVEIKRPNNADILIYAGWSPEECVDGAYVVGALIECEQGPEKRGLKNPREVQLEINELCEAFDRVVF